MEDPRSEVVQYDAGWPGFEVCFDRPTPVRAWLRFTTAIMGTLAPIARMAGACR